MQGRERCEMVAMEKVRDGTGNELRREPERLGESSISYRFDFCLPAIIFLPSTSNPRTLGPLQ